jgi:hypothetical protein
MDEGSLRRHVVGRRGAHPCLGEHRHRFHPGQGAPGGSEAPKARHRPGSALDAALVLLDRIVASLPAPVPGEAQKLAFPLHFPERAPG